MGAFQRFGAVFDLGAMMVETEERKALQSKVVRVLTDWLQKDLEDLVP